MSLDARKLESLDKLSDEAKIVIQEILSSITAQDANNWLDQVKVRNGAVAGTRYLELSKLLSFDSFVRLYEAIGYDFKKFAIWHNYACVEEQGIALNCVPDVGYSCDTDTCHSD